MDSINDKAGQKRLMAQYLFGELPARENAEFEDSYLKDDNVFQELVALENELIDQYILDELPSGERERFERSFLANPARRETVEAARLLLNYSAIAANLESSPHFRMKATRWRAGWAVQVAAAVVFLLMLGGISWLALNNRRMAVDLEKLMQERATFQQEQRTLERQIESLKTNLQQRDNENQMARLIQDTVAFTLEPAMSRGPGETTTLVIPPRAAYVFFRVVLKDDSHSRYSLSIRTVEGVPTWRQNNLEGVSSSGRNKELAVTVPSRLLTDGDYVLRVSSGGEDILHTLAGYSFHVVRRVK